MPGPRPPFLLLVLVALGLASGCLHRARPDEQPLVGKVRVEGNEALSNDDITSRIALTNAGRRWLSPADPPPFEAEAIRGDRRRIERLYASRGYHSARVLDVLAHEERGRVDLTFVVQEGSPTRVADLAIDGLDELPAEVRTSVLTRLPMSRGDVFEEPRLDSLKDLVRGRMRDAGYAEAKVEVRAVVDRGEATARVQVEATPGLRYRIGRVHVFGAQSVSRARVSDAAELVSGELYTTRSLAEAQRKVYALGIFSLVQVDPGPFNRNEATIPVIITVTEAPFQTVESGVGAEVDPTRDVARVRAKYLHRNIARGLQRLTLTGALGYAFLPGVRAHLFPEGRLGPQGVVGDIGAEFVQPQVGRSPVDLSLATDYAKDITQAFSFQRVGARMGFPIQFPRLRQVTLVPSFNWEYYFDMNVGPGLGPGQTPGVPVRPDVGNSGCGSAVVGGQTQFDTDCHLFFTELRLNMDFRDDQLSARRGWFFSLATQYAGTPLSQFNFLRISPELRGYAPAGRSVTFASRVRYGILHQIGEGRPPPGIARFFGGGATSVRSAAAQQLGPREFLVTDNRRYPQSSNQPFLAAAPIPVGGDRLLEGSVEMRFRTGIENLWLATFFDAGGITLGDDGLLPTRYHYGPGLGIRYHTPIGPVRFDLAWRLSTRQPTPTQVRLDLPEGMQYRDPDSGEYYSTDAADYRIASTCSDSGAPSFYCFQERRLQFFITVGEAF